MALGTSSRSHLLNPLPLDPRWLGRALQQLDGVDMARHVPVITTLDPAMLFIDTSSRHEASTAAAIYDSLKDAFPLSGARQRVDAQRLALDLALSSTILYCDDLDVAVKTARATPRLGDRDTDAQTPDELFTRAAGLLSLTDLAPPEIVFSVLVPRAQETDAGDADEDEVGEGGEEGDDPATRLQSITARTLLADWSLGADPREHTWKPKRTDEQRVDKTDVRPIRPLPSPSPSPRGQLTFPIPRQSIPTFETMPIPPRFQRSSPPPGLSGVSQADEVGHASTQVERGVFGGRPSAQGRRKVKKRVGGV